MSHDDNSTPTMPIHEIIGDLGHRKLNGDGVHPGIKQLFAAAAATGRKPVVIDAHEQTQAFPEIDEWKITDVSLDPMQTDGNTDV